MNNIEQPNIVSREEWLKARKEHLAQEKEFTRLRDRLSENRRELPWVRVDKDYQFHGPNGVETLADLFEGNSQLIVYHFMFDPEWEVGCKSCSFLADHYTPAIVHLKQRDITMVTVSSAPLEKLEAFKKRLGWNFKWLSSHGSDFNHDYHVTFTAEDKERGTIFYNFETREGFATETPGISVFYKDHEGAIYHTYSSYSRGLDMLISAYHLLDLTPKGRNEDELSYPMEWVRHNDSYEL